MLHAKFQDYRTELSSGSKEDFKGFLTMYGHDGHLGHVTLSIYIDFRPLFLLRLYMKCDFDYNPTGDICCHGNQSSDKIWL